MKYLKRFENNELEFNVGDCVYFKHNNTPDKYLKDYYNYIENNIGEIISVNYKFIMIIYNDVPNNIKKYFISKFDYDNKYYVSTDSYKLELVTQEEAERFKLKKDMKKYNL